MDLMKKVRSFLGCFAMAAGLFSGACSDPATGAPPVSIPAPAPASIRVTSPDEDGLVTVTGSAGAVTGGNTVRVTNLTTSGQASSQVFWELFMRSAWAAGEVTAETVAAADGSFSLQIAASIGDELEIVSIDPATGEASDALEISVADNAPPLSFSPAAVTADGAGRAFVAGTVEGAGMVAEISLELSSVTTTFGLDTSDPQAMDYDSVNDRLVIADPTNGRVLFVSLADTTVQTSVAVTGAGSVAVDAAMNCLVVGTSDATQSMVLINLLTDTVSTTDPIAHPSNPAATYQGTPAVDALNGQAVLVSRFSDGSSVISAIDLTVPAFTNQEVVSGSSLQGAALTAANQAVVVDNSNNQLLFADLTGASAVIPVDVGNSPRQVAADLAGQRVFVANEGDHTVSVVDVSGRTVSETVEVGLDPVGVAFSAPAGAGITANAGDSSATILP